MDKTAVLEMAASIGRSIRNSDLMENYLEAEKAYGRDEELQAAIAEYAVQQQALAGATSGQYQDETVAEAVKKRIDELYGIISRNPNFEAFNKARNELGALMDEINRMITAGISEGDGSSSGCTGNCATCGGCH